MFELIENRLDFLKKERTELGVLYIGLMEKPYSEVKNEMLKTLDLIKLNEDEAFHLINEIRYSAFDQNYVFDLKHYSGFILGVDKND